MTKSTHTTPSLLLSNVGLKNTKVRSALISLLSKTITPIDASTIIKKMKDVDTVTLYRSLKTLTESGILTEHHFHKDKALYSLTKKTHHHHIVCKTCGHVESLSYCIKNIENVAKRKSKTFKTIFSHQLDFFGTCRKCERAVR